MHKDLKAAVVRPTKTYLQKTTLFFNYRIRAYKNFIRQLFPERFSCSIKSNTVLDSTPNAYHQEENIQQMCCTISANRLLPHQLQTNRGLFNAFSGQKATPEQASDMLTFCQIGTKAVQQYVKYHILQPPSSAHAPVRRHKLLTMSNVKSS